MDKVEVRYRSGLGTPSMGDQAMRVNGEWLNWLSRRISHWLMIASVVVLNQSIGDWYSHAAVFDGSAAMIFSTAAVTAGSS
jgi:hypothetical protein